MSTRAPRAWPRESDYSKKQKRPPGKKLWEVVYTDPDTRKRRTKGGFSNKGAAQEWADQFMSTARRGEWIDPERSRVSFATVAAQWLAAQHFDRQRTRDDYRKIIEGNNDLTRTFNTTAIGDITPSAVSTFIKATAETKAPQTVRHRFYALRQVLDFAVENNMLLVNPARRVNVRRLPKPASVAEHERKRHRISPQQVDRLVAALPEPYDVFVLLVAATGMRPEEACGLTLGDVDTTHHAVSVRGVVVEVSGRVVREEATKTNNSRRTIDLDPYAGAALARYVSTHRARATKWFTEHPEHINPGADLPLFVGTKTGRANDRSVIDRLDYSKPMRYGAFYKRYWRKTCRAAGLPDSVRFYDLRHFHASMLLDGGGLTIKEVQERLGHASAMMTLDRYWHSDSDDEARKRRRAAVAEAMGRTTPDNVTELSKRTS